jgi:hypothetical protein
VGPPRGRPRGRRRDRLRRRKQKERNSAGVMMAAYRYKDVESSATNEENTDMLTACAHCFPNTE